MNSNSVDMQKIYIIGEKKIREQRDATEILGLAAYRC